jgi:hypothetical protein
MLFVIDDKTGDLLVPKMPNWTKIDEIISNRPEFKTQVLILAHSSVRRKLESANMHISMLYQSYKIRQTTTAKVKVDFLNRTMFDNVIFNLSSLLDSIAHEINQFYQFKLDFKRVQMDHIGSEYRPDCLRCLLNKENDDLAAHLNWELPWRRKNQTTNIDSWYHDFSAYRNQVMHRTIYFLFKTPGNNYLPDDPTFLGDEPIRPVFDENHKPIFKSHYGDPIQEHFESQRELRSYSDWCLEKILDVTEKIYGYLIEKV